jgi:hypothetical protein
VGEVLLMGSPLYLVLPLVKAALLVVVGGRVVRGRRWAMGTAIALEWFTLIGMLLGVTVGLLPGLAPAVTLVGLLTGVALPVGVIVLCARLHAGTPPVPGRARQRPPASAATLVEARVEAR